jgi:hypothetical protein
MEMTRREFVRAVACVASAAGVSRGEGVSPLHLNSPLAGILPASYKGGTPSPHWPAKYPGTVVPMREICKQSKWSG